MVNENLVHDMISGIAKGYADSYTKLFPCASIYVSEHRRSYKVGNQVVIENDKLVNSQGEIPTHEITKLECTLQDTKHVFTVRSLSTNEVNTIEL